MPRLIRKVPAYFLHAPSGQAAVKLNGRRIYLGRYDSQASRIAYDRLIAEWLARGRSSVLADEDCLTIAELIVRYWEYAKTYYRKDGKPTTEQACIRCALRPLRQLYGSTPVDAFDGASLEAVREHMIREGLTRNSVNKNVSRIKRLFVWGLPKKLVPADVVTELNAVANLKAGRSKAKESNPIRPVPDAIVEATLPFLPEPVMRMVMFQRLTGCRPGEACQLRPMDVDATGDLWEYRPGSHKTSHHGKQRVIAIGARAQGVIRPLMAGPKTRYCFRPSDVKPGAGERYDSNAYQKCVRRAAQRAGVEPWSPNQLRHSLATKVRKEYGLEAAQHILGHSRADVTEIYAAGNLEAARDVMRLIG